MKFLLAHSTSSTDSFQNEEVLPSPTENLLVLSYDRKAEKHLEVNFQSSKVDEKR